jgi:hypothetical protein
MHWNMSARKREREREEMMRERKNTKKNEHAIIG